MARSSNSDVTFQKMHLCTILIALLMVCVVARCAQRLFFPGDSHLSKELSGTCLRSFFTEWRPLYSEKVVFFAVFSVFEAYKNFTYRAKKLG